MKWTAAFAIPALVGTVLPAQADKAAPIVTIDTGALSGTRDGTVDIFKGIPYAAPPIGALRWEPPAAAKAWTGTRDASAFGTICPQQLRPGTAAFGGDQPQSEDCLFANVWTFDGAKKAPVMVWIHGGAFRFGEGSGRLYSGGDFARDGVILVSINYRLGALGFFAHPALTKAAAPDAPLGNFGIMDQIAALQWVQRNIAAFGGDPQNVTVFGESAGGESVIILQTLPQSRGLFAKAIVESGGGWYGKKTLADEEQQGVSLAQSAGLGTDATVDQLRALSADKLFNEPATLAGVGPFVDGRLIAENPTKAFADGREIHVPLLIGSNSYEASLMDSFRIPADGFIAQMPDAVKPLYSGDTQTMAHTYFTDVVMGAPAHWIAAKASADAPVYLYHFSYVPSVRRGSMPGAQHGGEIPFVFGDWPTAFNFIASAEDRAAEALVHSCWVAFAKTGTPACGGIAWPQYTPQSDTLMELNSPPRLQTGFRKPQYDALDRATESKLAAGN